MKNLLGLTSLLMGVLLAGCSSGDKAKYAETDEKLTLPMVQLRQQPTTVQRQ